MTISGFVAYVKQAWKNKPDTSTPLSAARLTHVEEGVKANSDAIAKIAAAVINQQANDANKIPSSALMYSVNEKVDSAISDLTGLQTNLGTAVGLVASRVIRQSDSIALTDVLSNYKYVIIRVTVSAYCRDTIYYAGGIGTPITINAGLQYNSTYYAYINLTFTDSGHIEVNLIDKSSAWAAHDVMLQVIGFKA